MVSNGSGAIAFGAGTKAEGDGTVAIGDYATAKGDYAFSFGTGAVANTRSVALGNNAHGKNLSVAIGTAALNGATGLRNTAIGTNVASAMQGDETVAIGSTAGGLSNGNQNTYVGNGAGGVVAGKHNVAVGYLAGTKLELDPQAEGNGYFGGGLNPSTFDNAVNVGYRTQALASSAIAVGYQAKAPLQEGVALGANSAAEAKKAIALGTNSVAKVENSVALGANSVATIAAGIQGRDVMETGKADKSPTWTSTAAAVSVGDVKNGITRQITSVAAGTEDTDAVNVSQLRILADRVNNIKPTITNVTNVTQVIGKPDNNMTSGNNIVIDGNNNISTSPDVAFETVKVGDNIQMNPEGIKVGDAVTTSSLPQAYLPGKSMISAAGGNYRGQSAIAIGVSTISDNGKWILKGSANANKDDFGFAVGAGYQW